MACLFMMTGCVEEYDADLPEGETRLLVVNGTICSNEYNMFQLTWSTSIKETPKYVGYSNNEPEPVTGARVTICGTDGTKYECTEYTKEEYGQDMGVYACDVPELNPDVSYYLTISYRNDVYQSTPEKPINTPDIDDFEYFQKDSLANIELLLTTATPSDPSKIAYYSWDYSETWELRPTLTTAIYFDMDSMTMKCRTKDLVYPKRGWKFGHNKKIITESTANYTDNRLTKYQLFKIPCDDERILWYYCCDLSQRAISKAEYEYEVACRQAGWEMGGGFSLLSHQLCLLTSDASRRRRGL